MEKRREREEVQQRLGMDERKKRGWEYNRDE
jgi:hypothetical protein